MTHSAHPAIVRRRSVRPPARPGLPARGGLSAYASLLACAGLAVALAGCGRVDRTIPTGAVPPDYHQRHPVVLTEAPDGLDVFLVGASGELDGRQRHDLFVFAGEYRTKGQGPIVIRLPRGAVNGEDVQRTLAAVRRTLVADGIRGTVEIGSYPVGNPGLVSPLHLSYDRLQAKVASRCGDWPADLNSGASLDGWQNRSYYNLGCASTQTLAAQVDDPRDLVRPRAEDPTDVQLRTRAIGLLRGEVGAHQGRDPGTAWTGAAPTPISPVGGD